MTDPADLFESAQSQPFPILLESAARDERFGCRTIFASNPARVLLMEDGRLSLFERGASRALREDPFEAVERLARDGAALTAGWIGYDLNRFVENVPQRARRAVDLPELLVAAYDRASVIEDGRSRPIQTRSASEPAMDPRSYVRMFGEPVRGFTLFAGLESNFSRAQYLHAIREAKERIAAGDIYEVNLSQRFSAPGRVGAPELYRRLRTASPAWYSAAMTLGRKCVVSSSPEEFLHLEGGELRTRPIKGTRRRGATPEEDQRLVDELAGSGKDDAELAMIVDLSRNDLGRVCEFGSVEVRAPKVVERHATVLHLSAEIAGRRRPDASLAQVLRAIFPGGSVTGAPKIRAMEIIDELEPDRRGIYAGALGWFGPDGSATLSMVIRTAVFDGERLHYQTGGAIVSDSVAEDEYQETLHKAEAFFRAIGHRP